MVSKNQIKAVSALHLKKNRQASGLFLAEGVKVITELLDAGFALENLFMTAPFFDAVPPPKKHLVTAADLERMSALKTANNCLAVFRIPTPGSVSDSGWVVALDDVRDPGNFGTIIRLCDWFGVAQVVCSKETAELYNPKVVQATMGSLARVNVTYADLGAYLSKTSLPVYGTFMDGENIYTEKWPDAGVVVFGNEANGISADVEKRFAKRISIPRFGSLQKTESLNVATAAAVVLGEIRSLKFRI